MSAPDEPTPIAGRIDAPDPADALNRLREPGPEGRSYPDGTRADGGRPPGLAFVAIVWDLVADAGPFTRRIR